MKWFKFPKYRIKIVWNGRGEKWFYSQMKNSFFSKWIMLYKEPNGCARTYWTPRSESEFKTWDEALNLIETVKENSQNI